MASKPRTRLSVLKNRSDFQRILKQGKRVTPASWLLIGYVRNDLDHMRCGWTLPRKVGTAVVRNKLKRWSREILRSYEDMNSMPIDINLVFRPIVDKDGENLLKDLEFSHFEKTLRKGLEIAVKRV